jgi:hypothetical protein
MPTTRDSTPATPASQRGTLDAGAGLAERVRGGRRRSGGRDAAPAQTVVRQRKGRDHPAGVTTGHSRVLDGRPMAEYEISVKGRVDASLVSDLGVLEADERPAITVLRGPLTGQDGLRELLSRLQDRGLELIEVRQLDAGEE